MKVMQATVVVEIEGREVLRIENTDKGFKVAGDLRGDEKEVFDPDGFRAMAELIRIFGYVDSHSVLVRALNDKDSEVVK